MKAQTSETGLAVEYLKSISLTFLKKATSGVKGISNFYCA
jgi:hypothetical protein